MQITQLYVYPIKSLGGIALQEARLTPRGIAFDRRWMLVDPDGQFFTQRKWPQMALLQTELTEEALLVSKRGQAGPALTIPLNQDYFPGFMQVRVWDDQCLAARVSDLVDEWFSEALGFACHLVYMPDTTMRATNPRYTDPGDIVGFADGYPYLVLGQASFDGLNARLAEPVPINRFRPNIVFSGGEPFEEDHWKRFRVGGAVFSGVKPCARCVMTTIDQQTASQGKEPLQTLSTYRRQGNDVYFGLNACLRDAGTEALIRVGEDVTNYE